MDERVVRVSVEEGVALTGDLTVPPHARGVVLFAHGSGSSRQSPRNRAVARALNDAALGTLLIDLLTPEDGQTPDTAVLANRLAGVIHWLMDEPSTRTLSIGLFGASVGAAAALLAAAKLPDQVCAVVSRGGRPDLAGVELPNVQAPTLLLVGGNDRQVLELNREAARTLGGEYKIEIVAGAGHLFEEPGALEKVAELAGRWFEQHLPTSEKHVPELVDGWPP